VETRFDPQKFESKWQREWAARGWFAAPAEDARGRASFCIMIPPPNVTGKLHMGHALQSTLQDVLTRWRRMRGDNALWLPGTDHAGIATQLMVERELAAEGLDRVALGRERFLERMWAWKKKYQDNIRRQLERMGASCDFSRERFTLDEGLSRAVREAFVCLHERRYIYRGEYIVNWSTGLDTAISDLEVEMRSVEDRLWRIAYPVAGSDERIVVATTRPETMLGDSAVAFHPDDERYAHLRGRQAVIPVAGREIPFVADAAVEREFGSGLVKVTPFHDAADFEIGRRHGLPGHQIIDRHGRMTEAAGPEFVGLSVAAAREKLLSRLASEGYLVGEERYVHNVGFCSRSGSRVEPLVSTQWFCDVSEMAQRALEVLENAKSERVRAGQTLELVPDFWESTWKHWLTNIRPWCISRQLWWGHQIPAWYDEAGNFFVERTLEEAIAKAGTDRLTQDPDVLDTWFSSALWPFSTLGWPDDTADLRTFYPTSVLVTGHDILFFWVARMVMFGLQFTEKSPFARVHLTGLVRDAEGEKMSKTKGNVLDPEDLIAEYGADAMRFTLATLDAPGRDIPLDASRMAGYRAFGNKIWNAARFVLTKAPEGRVCTTIDPDGLELPERWILHLLNETAGKDSPKGKTKTAEGELGAGVVLEGVNAALGQFRFDLACHQLYQFVWSDFCDKYIEMAKPGLAGDTARQGVADVLVTVLERALRLLHPVMPHITEELWQRLPGHEDVHPDTICLAPYPLAHADVPWISDEELEDLETFFVLVNRVNNARAERGVDSRAGALLSLKEGTDDDTSRALAKRLAGACYAPLFMALARVHSVKYSDRDLPPSAHPLKGHVGSLHFQIAFDMEPSKSFDAIAGEKERAEVEANLTRVRERLANPGFTDKAPAAVVAGARKQLAELEARQRALAEALADGASGSGET